MDCPLEKNASVLWTRTSDGFLLNNTETREFIDLQGIPALVWEFADGVLDPDSIASRIHDRFPNKSASTCRRLVRKVYVQLKASRFIIPRNDSFMR